MQEPGTQTHPREPAGRRRALFLAVLLLLPVLFFALLEGALRLTGLGGRPPLFVEAPGLPGHLQANPDVMQRYLPSRGEPIAKIEPILFRKEKPEDGYRIVVQGASTAAGFPYGRWGGLAGMLGDRLEAVFPDRELEVVTTAMAAVTSYTLSDLVDEIIAIRPDAVLVYAGHNEYVGVLGVGSALTSQSSRAAVRLHLRLRSLALYQGLQWIVSLVRSARAGDADRSSLFAQAAASAQIPFGSAEYRAGLRQFEANLGALLRRYQRAGIPVYIGTLVSNEKDLPPFAGAPAEHVDREEWERLFRAQRAHREAGETEAARRSLRRLLALDDAADAWYALAELEREVGRLAAAREAYRAARDRDRLRFRAPEAFNEIVRRLAGRYAATVVDVQRRFVLASPQGLVGDELLLEHVHPNAEGYFLLADAYYEALRRDRRIGDWSGAPSRAEARRDLPITALDRILADYDTRELKAGYPFRDPPQPWHLPPPQGEIERLARRYRAGEIDWVGAMESLLQIHRRQGRLGDAARVARLVAQAYPTDPRASFVAGLLLLRQKQPARARRYLERSLRADPDAVPTLRALARLELALGHPHRAREHLARIRQLAPGEPPLRRPGAPLRPERRKPPAESPTGGP